MHQVEHLKVRCSLQKFGIQATCSQGSPVIKRTINCTIARMHDAVEDHGIQSFKLVHYVTVCNDLDNSSRSSECQLQQKTFLNCLRNKIYHIISILCLAMFGSILWHLLTFADPRQMSAAWGNMCHRDITSNMAKVPASGTWQRPIRRPRQALKKNCGWWEKGGWIRVCIRHVEE